MGVHAFVFMQKSEAKWSEESRSLRQQKQALEVDLQLMKKERDLLKAQVLSSSGAASHYTHETNTGRGPKLQYTPKEIGSSSEWSSRRTVSSFLCAPQNTTFRLSLWQMSYKLLLNIGMHQLCSLNSKLYRHNEAI
jgi:hypothetical protein